MSVFYSRVCKLGDLRLFSFVSNHIICCSSYPCRRRQVPVLKPEHTTSPARLSAIPHKLGSYGANVNKTSSHTESCIPNIFSKKLSAFLKYIFRHVLGFYEITQSTTCTNSWTSTTFINQILLLIFVSPGHQQPRDFSNI